MIFGEIEPYFDGDRLDYSPRDEQLLVDQPWGNLAPPQLVEPVPVISGDVRRSNYLAPANIIAPPAVVVPNPGNVFAPPTGQTTYAMELRAHLQGYVGWVMPGVTVAAIQNEVQRLYNALVNGTLDLSAERARATATSNAAEIGWQNLYAKFLLWKDKLNTVIPAFVPFVPVSPVVALTPGNVLAPPVVVPVTRPDIIGPLTRPPMAAPIPVPAVTPSLGSIDFKNPLVIGAAVLAILALRR